MPLDLARNGPAAVHPRRHPPRRLRHRRQGAGLRRAVGQLQVPDRGAPPPRGQPRVVPRGGGVHFSGRPEDLGARDGSAR